MLCLVSLLHHRMVEGQMSVWRQMALLYLVEYLQKTVFWTQNSQMEGQMALLYLVEYCRRLFSGNEFSNGGLCEL